MAHSQNKHRDFEPLREQAVALRRAGLSRRQIRDRLHIHNNDILNRLLEGEPPPDWTRRPLAKDDLRARARELRLQGWTYDRIQLELGCSKSSISLWVRDLPQPERRTRTREEASAIARRGWEATLRKREDERRQTKHLAAEEIGAMTDRELFLVGVGLYWAEGSKSKPYRRQERIVFVNSDPGMITVFLAWLHLLGVERKHLRFAVHIHETADVAPPRCSGQNTSASKRPTSSRPLSRSTIRAPTARTPTRVTAAAFGSACAAARTCTVASKAGGTA